MNEEKIQKAKPKAAVATGFPCRHCGNQMAYSPTQAALYCAYCESTEPIQSEKTEAPEYLYFPDEDSYAAPKWEDRGEVILTCPSCGADTIMRAAAMTATCPFCSSHYVTEPAKDDQLILPETLIPFQISEGDARAAFSKWARKQWLAPRAFQKKRHDPALRGMYIPYWTFDAKLTTQYTGQGGRRRVEHYTVRVNGKTQTRTRTRTDWYPISGKEVLSFDNLPCPATKKIDRGLLEKIGPYSLRVLHIYNPAYLAGFFSERYSVGLGEGFATVRQQMEARMEAHIKQARGYDSYRFMNYTHQYEGVKFKHVLLPLWLAAYRYREKAYQFMVNGESGKVAGRAPLSALKVALLVAAGILAVGFLVLAVMANG